MRTGIVLGSALTAAVLTFVAALVGGVVAANQLSVTSGVLARTFLVIGALSITAFVWWMRMRPEDAPESLLVGLSLGWLLNPQSWVGAAYAGQLITDLTVGRFLIDLVLWVGTSFLLVLVLSRTSGAATVPR